MENWSMTEFFKPAPVDPFFAVRSDHACFGCGGDNPIGLRLRFAADGDGVKASFTPNPEHQGFHDVVHGGIISTILDEAMAWATAHAGVWAVTGEMRVRFRQPLEICELAIVTARVSGVRGRLVNTAAELVLDRDRSPIATASATFVRVGAEIAASWRARYLHDSGGVTAVLADVPPNAADDRVERGAVGPPGDDGLDLDDDH
jgi:acyl-coenzyme A thioesterase PaaI-like protein